MLSIKPKVVRYKTFTDFTNLVYASSDFCKCSNVSNLITGRKYGEKEGMEDKRLIVIQYKMCDRGLT